MDAKTLYELIAIEPFSISIDTRFLTPGDIYIAIKGDNFDGNSFAIQALEKGARYAIIDNHTYKLDERCILVSSTRETLEELAKVHRKTLNIPVLVIGGSNGKTTTKELTSAVLNKKYKVHTTKGNLNNDIGVPVTILEVKSDTEIAIIEIGANHPGEHIKLLNIISPTHVLVTNNGADHLEGFGSLEGARKANKEIYDWAHDNNAKAFVNESLVDLMTDSQNLNRITYPEVLIQSISGLQAGIIYEGAIIQSQLFGALNEANILAAVAIGIYFKVPIESIAKAVESYEPDLKRSQIIRNSDHTLIIDCYNANPSSMELALKDFFAQTHAGKRIVLIGDMLEMGQEEKRVHVEILKLVSSIYNKEDIIICIGPRFYISKEKFPFTFFEDTTTARAYFNTLNITDKIIFIKASRGIKIEEAIKEKVPL